MLVVFPVEAGPTTITPCLTMIVSNNYMIFPINFSGFE